MEQMETSQATQSNTRNRGFASMNAERQKEIARKGGKAAHEKGTAHEFTPDEAACGRPQGRGARQRRPPPHVPHRPDGRKELRRPAPNDAANGRLPRRHVEQRRARTEGRPGDGRVRKRRVTVRPGSPPREHSE